MAILLFQRFELVFCRKFRFDNRVTGFEPPRDEVRQAVIGLRAKDEINGLRPADDFRPSAWATQPATATSISPPDSCLGFLQSLHPAKFRIDFFRRMLADMAGVEDHQVGKIGNRRFRIAHGLQRVAHALAVIDIHLAAIGFNVNRLLGQWSWPVC